jgi:TPR repeat protein
MFLWLAYSQQVTLVYAQQIIPKMLSHPFADAPIYDRVLMPLVRLHLVGCGLKGKLVRLLSQGVDRNFDVQLSMRTSNKMMQHIVRRIAAGLPIAVRNKVAKEAERLCALGQCAAAVVPMSLAIELGDLPSRALCAWLHLDGREGIAEDWIRAFKLVKEGARLGCHHCQGVLAYCYWSGFGCKKKSARKLEIEQSLDLSRTSSARGSRYGQYMLGLLHRRGEGGLVSDDTQALAFYRLAAAQGLDAAQVSLGHIYSCGRDVDQDYAEALRLYQLAAAQGSPDALYHIAVFHTHGYGVEINMDEAIHWYRRAKAAGHLRASRVLNLLLLCKSD